MSRTFDIDTDLSHFSKEARHLLHAARHLDWSIRWLTDQHQVAQITSPGDEHKTINIPTTNVNANRVKSWVKQLRRYSDDRDFVAYVEMNWPTAVKVESLAPRVEVKGASFGKPQYVLADSHGSLNLGDAHPDGQQRAAEASSIIQELLTQDDEVEDTHRVVSTKPWLVRKAPSTRSGSAGSMYESHSVSVVTFSDGRQEYRCNFCEYEHPDNPRSVSAHAAKAHPEHPRPEEPQILHVDDYQPSGQTRSHGVSDSAARRLRADLLNALDSIEGWQQMSREALAEALAEAVVSERPEREPREPLTPEQVVHRIALLVDGGRVSALHRELDAMAEAVASAKSEAQECRLQADRLREERRALAAMLQDEDA